MRLLMKLPSIRQTIQQAGTTLRRFPLVICDATLATGAALILADHEGPSRPTILFNILLAGALGIPLLIGLALLSERKRFGRFAALGLQLVGVLVLAGYAFTVPTDLTHAPLVTLFRFYIIATALHLFVAIAPFATKGEANGFWHYNRTLFFRLLISFLYSVVLYAGLSIALAALENLFGIDIPGKRYLELWILIIGLFNTWFFLAGVPDDLGRLDAISDYPKGLRVFAQYILFPIVLIYLVILYAYLGKILVSWDWPQGYVSKLILGFSGIGIFLLLFLPPLRDRAENVWVTKAARWFYIVLVPLVLMLLLSVWRRVSEYGVTEGRYLAIALGVWLTFLILYFSLGKTKGIKVIPVSLCVLALLISFGPWGVFSVASQSQVGRLKRITTEAGIITEGKIQPVHAEVSFKNAKEISAILSYLHEYHGLAGIQGWFEESLKEDTIPSGVAYKRPAVVARMMGLEYVSRWAESQRGTVTFTAANPYDLTGYDRIAQLTMFARRIEHGDSLGEGVSYRVTADLDSLIFRGLPEGEGLLQIDLQRHAEQLLSEYDTSATGRIPGEKLAVESVGRGFRVRVCPWQLQLQRRDGEMKLVRIDAVILYSLENAQ
jgi:Domain of unknown function (DUF4153)